MFTLAGWVERIPAGDPGTQATIGHMASMARNRSIHPAIRAAAVGLLRFHDGNDQAAHARAIAEFLDQRVHFLPDPTLAEALHDPLEVLAEIAQHGIARVDCDDVATFAAALGLSVGLKPQFVIASFSPTRRYSHVWTEFVLPYGRVVPVDPTRPLTMPTVTRSWTVPLW